MNHFLYSVSTDSPFASTYVLCNTWKLEHTVPLCDVRRALVTWPYSKGYIY